MTIKSIIASSSNALFLGESINTNVIKLTLGVLMFESSSKSSSASSSSCPTPDSSEIGSSGFCTDSGSFLLLLLPGTILLPLSLAPRNPSVNIRNM